MRTFFVLSLAAFVCVAAATTLTVNDEEQQFADYMQMYHRTYTGELKAHRFECFCTNLKLIQQRNARGTSKHGINEFTDLCPDEFAKMYLGMKSANKTHALPTLTLGAPKATPTATCSIDWRAKGVVTPVSNQGQCGAVGAFAAVGVCESVWALAGHELVSLSVGEVVACDSNGQGCDGGLTENAYQWIVQNGGIDSAADYPMGLNNFQCVTSKLKNIVASFSQSVTIPSNETEMAAYVCQAGPISVYVDAATWFDYQGGILDQCPGNQIDHAVIVVGVNLSNQPPYWILKNSWGTSWGENGYLYLQYGSNLCGITTAPMSIIAK